MKHIRTYGQFRSSDPVNEELLGGLINFFKNMWGKAMEELKSLGDNPSVKALKNWVKNNAFNASDNNYMFKTVLDNFNKLPETGVNELACLNLVQDIIDPEKGAVGKQGLQPLYDSLKKEYKDNLAPTTIVEYLMMTVRNGAIKQYKYAGGPDGGKVDPKKIITDMKDQTHLPEVKKLLTGKQPAAMKKAVMDWCQKTLIPGLVKALDAIKVEDVNKYLEGKDIEVPEEADYEVGDTLIYLLKDKKKEDWDKLSDEEKKKPGEEPASEIVGVKKVEKIEGKGPEAKFTFKGADGNDIVKDASEIVGKSEGEADEEGEYKAGDSVIYKRDKWEDNKGQEAWDKMSDDEKTKPNEGKLKELIDDQSVGIKTIKTVEKDFVRFTDVDWIKQKDEILGKVDAKAEGQDDLVNKLKELKSKQPEDIKKVASYVDFISDEKNKDKVAEMDKLMGGEEEGK